MTFQGVFRLDGRFEGEIFESGTLIVGEAAQVKGKIEAATIIIHGLVEGEIEAGTRVEIHGTGRFFGNLLTRSLTVEDGGILDGTCRMEAPSRPGGTRTGFTVHRGRRGTAGLTVITSRQGGSPEWRVGEFAVMRQPGRNPRSMKMGC